MLQIALFSVKIAKSQCFISLLHFDKGDLGSTSQIALVYLPSSLMLYIKFGCNSSPLYFHTHERTLGTWFSHVLRPAKNKKSYANPLLVLVEEGAWPETSGLLR